jgi:hypothetical protein
MATCPHCQTAMREAVEIIPVGRAVLCANCNCITESTDAHCRSCGSLSVFNIERMLGGHNLIPCEVAP